MAKVLKYQDLFNGFMNQLKQLESKVASASSEINCITATIPDSLLPQPPNIVLSPATPGADTADVNNVFLPTLTSALQSNIASPSTSTASPVAASDTLNPAGLVVVSPTHRNKVVFLSRFSPNTTVEQLLTHVKSKCSNTPHTSKLICHKITSRIRPPSEALISSFKMFVPPELFETVCSATFWPSGVLVKEFVPRTVTLPALSENFPLRPATQQPPPRTQ